MKAAIVLCSISCIILGISGQARALATVAPKGLTVSPAITQIALNSGQTTATFTIMLTDNTISPLVVSVHAMDFTALNERGALAFLPAQARTTKSHGLASNIQIGLTQISLAPAQSQVIPVTIANANTLASGGHYAALTFAVLPAGPVVGNNVNIKQAVSSLVFLTTAGAGNRTITLIPPVTGLHTLELPKILTMVFADTGNTQSVLHGVVQLINPSGQLVGQGILNIDSGLILPDSRRLFAVTLQPQTVPHTWLGFYHVKVLYRHDGQAAYTAYTTSFLYINEGLIATGVAAIGTIAAIVVLYRKGYIRVRSPSNKKS